MWSGFVLNPQTFPFPASGEGLDSRCHPRGHLSGYLCSYNTTWISAAATIQSERGWNAAELWLEAMASVVSWVGRLLRSSGAIRKECECQWNIITPSPPIGFPTTFDLVAIHICNLNPDDSKGKGDLDRVMLMKSGQVWLPDILVGKVCGWFIGWYISCLFCNLVRSKTWKRYLAVRAVLGYFGWCT